MDMTRWRLGKFLVVPTLVTRCLLICKAARDPSGKRWNYMSTRLYFNFVKMTAFTPFRYLFLDLRTCIGTNQCVSYLSARPSASLSHVCAWIMTRAKWWKPLICDNLQRIYTEYGTGTRIEPTEATGIYSFVFISYVCWVCVRIIWRYKWWNTFNGILPKTRLYRR